jgi:hypothetical protein
MTSVDHSNCIHSLMGTLGIQYFASFDLCTVAAIVIDFFMLAKERKFASSSFNVPGLISTSFRPYYRPYFYSPLRRLSM